MVHFPEFVKPLHLGSTLGHKGHLAFFFVKNAKTRFAIFREGITWKQETRADRYGRSVSGEDAGVQQCYSIWKSSLE
ncbi:hypothetical protein N8550_01900 [Pirellulaceae bacterium]|nr:hypothetical protein [Pirellulaceae bacterium]